MRRIAVGPADRFRVFVVARDVAPDLPREIGQRGEDASREQVAFDFGKPEFDLIEPGRIRRREVQMDAGMRVEKRLDLLGFMRREVIDNDVDLAPPRLRATMSPKKSTNASLVCRGTVWPMISPVRRVERGIQGERAVAVVLKPVPFRAARRQRQHRIQAIQGLNRRLFIGRKHHRMLRRIQVEPDDIGRLLLRSAGSSDSM